MNTRNIRRITVLSLFVIVLAVLFSSPAQAQNTDQQDEEQTWFEKFYTSEGIEQQFQNNSLLFFVAIFALGVGTSLTPCVLPMIPITMSIVSGSKQQVTGRSPARSALAGLASSLVYVLGVSITYATLGVLAVVLGFVVQRVIQGCAVLVVIGAIFAVLGLSMLGLFSLPIPGWGRNKFDAVAEKRKTKRSLLSVLILGLISGIIASPCVAPVIGALLIWISQAGRIWLGFWALFTFGWGMGLLLIVVGFTGWSLSSGKWMVTVKAILGVLLVLMGLWSAVRGIQCKPIIPVWLLGGTPTVAAEKPPSTTETSTKTPTETPTEVPTEAPEPKPTRINWISTESEGLALAKETGKPLFIEFYTEQCGYCALMDRTTFKDQRVIDKLAGFVSVKMNLSRYTAEAEAAAYKYNVIGVPMFVFIDTQGRQTVRSGYMPTDSFLMVLDKVK